jgi:hypothetical protein
MKRLLGIREAVFVVCFVSFSLYPLSCPALRRDCLSLSRSFGARFYRCSGRIANNSTSDSMYFLVHSQGAMV